MTNEYSDARNKAKNLVAPMKKRNFTRFAPLVLAVALGAPTAGAMAGTTAFVTGGLLKQSMDECLKSMKSAANKSGFTEYQETLLDDNKKAGDFHADQKDSPLHVTARCDPQEGVWSVAISGVDTDQTLEGYKQFFKGFD